MKILLIILFFSLCCKTNAQELGIINDPDGYTHIREGKGTSFNVIGRITEGQQFKYFPDETNWWKIETIVSFGEPVTGYVHKSRIQPYVLESSTNCKCQLFNKETDQKPDLIAQVGQATLTFCGYVLQRYSQNSIQITEFSITNCNTKQMMKFYGAVTTCNVTYQNGALEIVELHWFPVGEHFRWVQIPFSMTKIYSNAGNPEFSERKIIFDLSHISTSDVKKFEQELPNYKGKGYFEEIDTFIGQLAVCAMKGSDLSENILNGIDHYLNFVLDGATREFYNDARSILNEYKKR